MLLQRCIVQKANYSLDYGSAAAAAEERDAVREMAGKWLKQSAHRARLDFSFLSRHNQGCSLTHLNKCGEGAARAAAGLSRMLVTASQKSWWRWVASIEARPAGDSYVDAVSVTDAVSVIVGM